MTESVCPLLVSKIYACTMQAYTAPYNIKLIFIGKYP